MSVPNLTRSAEMESSSPRTREARSAKLWNVASVCPLCRPPPRHITFRWRDADPASDKAELDAVFQDVVEPACSATPPSSLEVSLSTSVVTIGEGDTAFLDKVTESAMVVAVAEAGNLPGSVAITPPAVSEVSELEVADSGNLPGGRILPRVLLLFDIAGGGDELCAFTDGGYLPGKSLITGPMLSLVVESTESGNLPGSAIIKPDTEKDAFEWEPSSSSNTVANAGIKCCCCEVSRIQRSTRSIRSSMLSPDMLAGMPERLGCLCVCRRVGQVAADGCMVCV